MNDLAAFQRDLLYIIAGLELLVVSHSQTISTHSMRVIHAHAIPVEV